MFIEDTWRMNMMKILYINPKIVKVIEEIEGDALRVLLSVGSVSTNKNEKRLLLSYICIEQKVVHCIASDESMS